ncbi:alkaline phosphatase family protein [Thermodesulfatator atlanticus]|uniref:alkaline phosphatase family protein n=1 Tax=Thermodesulfatator atlanticus TaxID=501497 RepID=UPI0003B61468|nr:alkaline phosphatase family protein [Thermodesulfatator atlanticus]
MAPKRCVLILLDGLSDRAHQVLGNKTPLEAAKTPSMDILAQRGLCGLMHASEPGVALPSEQAHFAMFGFAKDFPGRGPLEALGAEIKISPGDVAILARFVGVKQLQDGLVIIDNSPQLTAQEKEYLVSLVASINIPGVKFSFHPVSGTRGILIVKGEVSPFVSDSDPLSEGAPIYKVEPTNPEDALAAKTAEVLNKFLYEVWQKLEKAPLNQERLKKGFSPVNFLATHRAGKLGETETFNERWGLRAASISSGIIYWGIGKYLGFHVEKMKDYKDPAQELDERLLRAKELAKDFDFIHIHHKGPDEAAHRKDPLLKKKTIEALDKALSSHLDWLLSPENLVILTSDHATPSSGKMIHSGEPVPVVFCGEGVWPDNVKKFSEVSCTQGALSLISAKSLMYLVLNFLDRGILAGLCYGKTPRAYYPCNARLFEVKA